MHQKEAEDFKFNNFKLKVSVKQTSATPTQPLRSTGLSSLFSVWSVTCSASSLFWTPLLWKWVDLASALTESFKKPSLNPTCLPWVGAVQRLLLKMLQPDEGILAPGRMLWAPAKASGVNRVVLLCVVLSVRYIAQCWCFISRHDD